MQPVVSMSNEQAHAFALAIFPAIRGYVDEHREEYEEFLKEWEATHITEKKGA